MNKDILINQVDILIAEKKRKFSNIDISLPKSIEEKELDKKINSIFSQIQEIIQNNRKNKHYEKIQNFTK
jgi:hypothetical protein